VNQGHIVSSKIILYLLFLTFYYFK